MGWGGEKRSWNDSRGDGGRGGKGGGGWGGNKKGKYAGVSEADLKKTLDDDLDAYFGKKPEAKPEKVAIIAVGLRVRNPKNDRRGVVTEFKDKGDEFKLKFDDDGSEDWRPISRFEGEDGGSLKYAEEAKPDKVVIIAVGLRVRNPKNDRKGVVTEFKDQGDEFKLKFDDDGSEDWRPISRFEGEDGGSLKYADKKEDAKPVAEEEKKDDEKKSDEGDKKADEAKKDEEEKKSEETAK